jgi:hypothetical protein
MYVENDIEIDGTAYANDLTLSGTATFIEFDNGNSGTADTIDWVVGQKQLSTLTDNCTYSFIGPNGAGNFLLRVVIGGSGSYTTSWPGNVKWPDDTAPTTSTTVGATDIYTFYFKSPFFYGAESKNYP